MMQSDLMDREKLEILKRTLYQHHGSCPVTVTIHFAGRGEVDIEMPKDLTISPCRSFTDDINKITGFGSVSFETKPIELQARKKNNGWHANGKK